MKFFSSIFVIALLGVVLAWSSTAFADATLPDRPIGPNGEDWYVLDTADILSGEAEAALQSKLATLVTDTSTAMVVVTMPTLDVYPLEEYALDLGRTWGVGQNEYDNGLVFLMVMDTHDIRIEVGRGLEGAIPDASAFAVIDKIATPAFRNGDFDGGVIQSIDALDQMARGEPYNWEGVEDSGSDISVMADIVPFIFLMIFIFFSLMSHSKSWWLGGVIGGFVGFFIAGLAGILLFGIAGLVLDFILSKYFYKKIGPGKGGFFGGGFGGGSGGFGGGGFGGGGFGGGGASGRW